MKIYSYYYGASSGRGIGVQAQSEELKNLSLSSDLKDLSSFHALGAPGQSEDTLSFMLRRGDYSIIGQTYTESPGSSGYGRSAPCGLQYIVSGTEMAKNRKRLDRIINFIRFEKPSTVTPAPLSEFPQAESGYLFHNSTDILMPLVNELARVATSTGQILLIGLPLKKNSEYSYARFTIAEALSYIPVELRLNIRFFTGLPVPEGVWDPEAGFDNAVRYGANVIFCSNENYLRLKNRRSFTGLDLSRPSEGGPVGEFANYITQEPPVSYSLSLVKSQASGQVTFEGLNKAAQKVKSGKLETIFSVREQLKARENELAVKDQEIGKLKQAIRERNDEIIELKTDRDTARYGSSGSRGKKKFYQDVFFYGTCALFVIAAVLAVLLIVYPFGKKDAAPQSESPYTDVTPTPEVISSSVSVPSDGPTAEPAQEPAPTDFEGVSGQDDGDEDAEQPVG